MNSSWNRKYKVKLEYLALPKIKMCSKNDGNVSGARLMGLPIANSETICYQTNNDSGTSYIIV